ncbi:hypothetical protein NDU88_001955 [Pleurodeles waltl]|uniref:Uncharacterized protein n=1 Tax=Pleurodeles waltl TaxID=8319 RepID=A0AAV7LB82_PLEWA|nr:hypothetical protein NDU88_001955 [Pleurodeles waltl]
MVKCRVRVRTVGCGDEGWEMDYREDELEGEIAECEAQESEWWLAPVGIQRGQGEANQRNSLGVLQADMSTVTALAEPDPSDLRTETSIKMDGFSNSPDFEARTHLLLVDKPLQEPLNHAACLAQYVRTQKRQRAENKFPEQD